MEQKSNYLQGQPCWFEIVASDIEGTESLMGQLFEWTTAEMPMEEGQPPYKLLQLENRTLGGLYSQNDRMSEIGISEEILNYLTVSDLATVLKKVPTAGGTVVMDLVQVSDMGQMAIVREPSGAAVAFWEPKNQHGSEVTGVTGAVSWLELATRESDKVAAFFAELLDLEIKKVPFPEEGYEGYYLMLGRESTFYFGILQMTKDWGDLPSHWMLYIQVDSADETVSKVSGSSGKVCYKPFDLDGVGRIAILEGPGGFPFSVIQPVKKNC